MITRLGELSLSAAVPLLAQFSVALSGANGIAIPQLQAQLTGLGNVLGAITVAPPALGATITAALATVASLQAAIGGPVVTLQVGAIAAQISLLSGQLGDLLANASLAIPSATVSVYVFDGPSGDIGVELQSAINGSLPGVGGHANALILATTSAPAWASVQLVFAT
jgi:hypothetical protein